MYLKDMVVIQNFLSLGISFLSVAFSESFEKFLDYESFLKEVFLPLSLSVFLLAFDEFQQKGALFLSRFIQDPVRVRLGAVVVW